jgi:hypothetical protein
MGEREATGQCVLVVEHAAAAERRAEGSGADYRFEDYPISNVYRGNVRLPDFRGPGKKHAMFRTRIVDGMRNDANFAGKYSVIKIGCGTGCRFFLIADVTSGSVLGFPLSGEDLWTSGAIFQGEQLVSYCSVG